MWALVLARALTAEWSSWGWIVLWAVRHVLHGYEFDISGAFVVS